MQTQPLGTSELQITPIGLGTWAIGGTGWAFAWGKQDDQESIAAIRHALDLGINWIDTAPIYGLGHSEEIVAEALEGYTPKPLVFTKCGLLWDAKGVPFGSLKRDSVRGEVEDSLRRLNVDVLDLCQVHWPNPDADIEEGWTTLAELQQEGKIRYLGVSNFSISQLRRAQKIAPITSLQPPYSLLERGIEQDIIGYCETNQIGIIAYSPMGLGLLTGTMTPERISNLPPDDHRRNRMEFLEPRLSRNLKLVALLEEIGKRHGRAPAEVAIAWVLRLPSITGAIVGARRPHQVDGFIGAGEFRLQEDEIEEIESFVRKNP